MFYVDVWFKDNLIATHRFEFESKALDLVNKINNSNYGYNVVMRDDNDIVLFDSED